MNFFLPYILCTKVLWYFCLFLRTSSSKCMFVRTASSPRCVTWRQNCINVDPEASFSMQFSNLLRLWMAPKFLSVLYMWIFFFRTLLSIFTMAKTFFFLKPYSCFLDFQQREVTTFGKVIWKWNLFCYWSLAWVIFAAFSLIRSLVKSFVWA